MVGKVFGKLCLKLIFGHVVGMRLCRWLIRAALEDLWVFLCSIERFDLYASGLQSNSCSKVAAS